MIVTLTCVANLTTLLLEKKNPIYKLKLQSWNNDCHEDYWWNRRVFKLQKLSEKRTLEEANQSVFKIGVEASILSYKSMGKEVQYIEYSPSAKDGRSASAVSNPLEKSSRNLGVNLKQTMRKNDLNVSRNHLTSKNLAKDILNKSGLFATIANPKLARIGTLAPPTSGNFVNKSALNTSRSKSKPKEVSLCILIF